MIEKMHSKDRHRKDCTKLPVLCVAFIFSTPHNSHAGIIDSSQVATKRQAARPALGSVQQTALGLQGMILRPEILPTGNIQNSRPVLQGPEQSPPA